MKQFVENKFVNRHRSLYGQNHRIFQPKGRSRKNYDGNKSCRIRGAGRKKRSHCGYRPAGQRHKRLRSGKAQAQSHNVRLSYGRSDGGRRSFAYGSGKHPHNPVQRRFGGCGNRACGRAPQRIRFKKLSSSVKGNLRLHFRRLSAVARFAYAQRTDRGRRNPYTHTKRVFCPRRVKSADKHHKNRKNAS